MASSSQSGAGENIVTNRRKQRPSATPYDQPPPQSPSNWLTGLIIPSARALASGTGKIVSSIFSELQESSSSEYDDDFVSEDEEDNEDEYENTYHGRNASHKENITSSEIIQYKPASQLGEQRTETKQIIKHLITQETFSREECDRLIKVLNSRVTDWPIAAENGDVDVYNKTVLEAKQWVKDKKTESSSKLTQESCSTNSTGFEHVEIGGGSPVDVARSYMNERPPWASPTKNIELNPPSTTTMKLFKEVVSNSVGPRPFSLSKKRNSLASGSWNIHEELRRVRSKATEDMLRTPPSKHDPSWFTVASSQRESAGADKALAVSVVREIRSRRQSSKNTNQIDALVDAGLSHDPALAVLALPALESRQDGKPSEPASSVCGINETSDAVQMDKHGESKFSHTSSSTNHEERHAGECLSFAVAVPRASKINGSVANKVMERNLNGHSSSEERQISPTCIKWFSFYLQ